MKFFYESFLGDNGKVSSKRVTAFWFVVLITTIVVSIISTGIATVYYDLTLKEGLFRVLDIEVTILLYLIGAIMVLYGVQGWQQVSTAKILNPAPPTENKNIIQQPNIENVNINQKDETNP